MASQRVQKMLDEVDIVMYDPPLSRPEPTHLANECRDWTSAFPHIRYVQSRGSRSALLSRWSENLTSVAEKSRSCGLPVVPHLR